ncbi:unnamed protein product, partial [Choristocarpus tenellus]
MAHTDYFGLRQRPATPTTDFSFTVGGSDMLRECSQASGARPVSQHPPFHSLEYRG